MRAARVGAVRLDAIPEDLRTYSAWVTWRYEERPGESKPTKVPYDPLTGLKASTADSRTWAAFDKAAAAFEAGDYDGLGYVFSSGDPFTGVDLDGCRDPETGALEEWAARIVNGLGGYTEASPSAGGVHVIVRGKLPEGARHKIEREGGGAIEAYSERRFFTVTARGALVSRIPDRQDALDRFARRFLMDPEPAPNGNSHRSREDAAPADLSDEEIITLCRKAKNAAKFSDLFDHGDTSRYDYDDSRADQALADILAFYSDDPAQIERIFSDSALGQRPKWRRRADYRHATIGKALSRTGRERYKRPVTVTVTPNRDGNGNGGERGGSEGAIRSVSFAEIGEPAAPESVVEPVVPKGWPTTIFGGTGVLKTLLTLSMAQAVADPGVAKWLRWDVATTNVVYLDYELNAQMQGRRAYALARGNGKDRPPPGLRYMTTFGIPRRRRRDVLSLALAECEKYDAGLLVIDSLGLAMQGDPGDFETVLEWFDEQVAGILGAGVTPVMVDHMRRLQAGENYQTLGAYGSVWKDNLSRSMLQIELIRRDRENHSVLTRLRPKKASFEELGDPLDVKTVFEDGRIHLYESALEEDHKAGEETLNAAERVLAALDALGEAGPEAIAEACGTLKVSTVIKEISKLRSAGQVEDTGEMEGTRHKVRRVTVTKPYKGNGNGNGGGEPAGGPVEEAF